MLWFVPVKTPKFSVKTTALVSVAVFLFHLTILCASLLKLNAKIWSVYKNYCDTFDLTFFGLYCFTFIIALAVWFFADAPASKRALYAGVLFPLYFVISLVACIIVCHVYAVGVWG
jgi:hypothetical protein